MRKFFVIAAIVCFSQSYLFPQVRFVDRAYEDYYQWFHERSQVNNLYSDGAELFTFSEVSVREGACLESETVTCLPMGYRIVNIVDEMEELPKDEINGYHDLWYHVSGSDASGKYFNGYIWGAYIAKSWQFEDVDGDGIKDLAMLGIGDHIRKSTKDINAEIRIVRNGKLLTKTTVPGLCVFEECASSTLLRILKDQPCKGALIVEVSTMTIGCAAGIEKAYYFQTPSGNLERVFHAELTSNRQYRNRSFEYTQPNGDTVLCRFSHDDDQFNPVWNIKKVKSGANSIAETTRKKARA
ncbi:MAG: hypothetical protein DWQ02_08435 [Bacteroidetes bacterium]|nr:MAG: hypothetical protein DWQ02_08435 [Bacteroidota bacterium]